MTVAGHLRSAKSRRRTVRGYVILAVVVSVVSWQHGVVQAQGLFNKRASTGRNQASATTGSMFPSITGFPQSTNASNSPTGGRSFIGRSNRGFVGGRAASPSPSENNVGNARRSTDGTRRADERKAAPPSSSPAPPALPGRSRRTTIVPRHRIAFEFSARKAATISDQLQAQLQNLTARRPGFARIQVQVDANGRVKLQGQVSSEGTRKLVAILVRLEPGVRGVQNELSVVTDRE